MSDKEAVAGLQTILFDVGGVLVGHDNALLTRRLAADCAQADASPRIEAIGHDPAIGTGELPIPALHRRLVEAVGYRGDLDRFLLTWSSHFSFDRAMLDLAAALERRYRVALFSNTNQAHWDWLTGHDDGALGRFERYLSHEIGLVKPDPASFRHVAAAAGIDPATTLFVDDRADNVAAAEGVGFHGHHFTGIAGLVARLDGF